MKPINAQLALAKSALLTNSGTKQSNSSSSTEYLKTASLVNLLFTRMGDLYGDKCKTKGLVIYADRGRGIHSQTFQLWCKKLHGLTEQEFAYGMKKLEERATALFQQGEEMWPPSYAEFIGLCSEPKTCPAHKYFEPTKKLEDKTAREKRRQLGQEQCSKLLDFLND